MKKLSFLIALLWCVPAFGQQLVPINAGAVTINTDQGQRYFKVLLTANVTSVTFTGNPVAGAQVTVLFTEDSVGGRTVAGFASNISNPCSVSTTTAAATTVCEFQYDSLAAVWNGTQSGGGGGGGGACTGPGCILATSYGVKANAHWVQDATLTNGSAVVTCPAGECKFLTSAARDQVAWATINSCVLGGSTLRIQKTTIASVDSDTQITLNATSNGNQVANACLFWGDVDLATDGTGPWKNAWNAFMAQLKNGPATLVAPCGASMISTGIANNPSVNVNWQPTIQGCAPTSSVLLTTPDMNWSTTNCDDRSVHWCFFGGLNAVSNEGQIFIHDIQAFGGGSGFNYGCATGGANFAGFGAPSNIMMRDVYIDSMCPSVSGGGNINGIRIGGPASCFNCQSDAGGNTAFVVTTSGQPVQLWWPFAGDAPTGMSVTGAGTVTSIGGTFGGSSCGQGLVLGSAGQSWNSYGEVINGLNQSNGASIANIHNGLLTGANCAAVGNIYYVSSGALTNIYDHTVITPSGTTDYAATGTGTLTDGDGTNIITAGDTGYVQNTVTYVAANNSINARCTGTATASQTLGLYGTGANVIASACTSTTIGNGQIMTRAGTLKALIVSAGTGGVNASSGVVTVLKNGSTTTMTCTLGTGTTCQDFTHTQAFVAGDLISIQFTTQAAETLANVRATVAAN